MNDKSLFAKLALCSSLGLFSCAPASQAADIGHPDASSTDSFFADQNQPDHLSNNDASTATDARPADRIMSDSSSTNDASAADLQIASDSASFDANIDPGTDLGLVQLTYYWISDEDEFSCSSPDTDLRSCAGVLIATVCQNFAESARMEGTAHLSDGRSINIGSCSCNGGFSCFMLLDEAFPWGMGNRNNPLQPFYSIATDTGFLPSGTKVYSPDIKGLALPADLGGGLHNGCMEAADVGGGINGAHIDFFVGRKLWYQQTDPFLPENIRLYRDPSSSLCP